MQLEILRQPEQTVAKLSGELDHHAAGELRERIDQAVLQQPCIRLVLDLSGLSFMDSSGIGLIMGRYRLLRSLGGSLMVQGANPRLETVIRLAGMEKLPIWPSTERKNDNESNE